ncbi:DUF4156 domain-containing protein [Thiotrichales bacterium 19S3-7]|nr:DUF4156 domain-containing protein [Thiotrichales bacterium 19S3-7]MCF6800727.1 DUF4156 domain-containing protein [Thiotrichales bacterium 19S3-11]
MTKQSALITIGLAFLLSGCTFMPPRDLDEQAKSVAIKSQPPSNNQCQYMGIVVSPEGWMLRNLFTSNEDLTIGAYNTIRNRAKSMNINYIELFKQKSHQTTFLGIPFYGDVLITGIGYNCDDHKTTSKLKAKPNDHPQPSKIDKAS